MHVAEKLHQAVDAAIEAGDEEPFRKHLGASVIGDECPRKIWYGFRWTLAEKFGARMLRLFNRGHELEPRFVRWLRAAGMEIFEAGESGESKAQMRISAHEGHFGGTPDGIGRGIPDLGAEVWVLLEMKSHNAKSFGKIVSDGIMSSKWKHYVQMQIYMHFHKLKWALYCAINKDTDEVRFELVRYDKKDAERFIERAGEIIWTSEPPSRIGKNPAAYACKFCHLQRLCHFGDVAPHRNCRSCQWSAPIPGGDWTCRLLSINLTEPMQRAACPRYTVNPALKQKS